MDTVEYPAGRKLSFAFAESPIEVWEEKVVIVAAVKVPAAAAGRAELAVTLGWETRRDRLARIAFQFQEQGIDTMLEEDLVDLIQARFGTELSQARQAGQVLVMDQRQLRTFGNIRDVTLVPEYEMKYMMDKSMAGNPASFIEFYQDLKDHRFALIVSSILKVQSQGSEHDFGEENDAWDRWVASAVLCYYKPLQTVKEVRVQLLVPRASPGENCP